METANPPRTEAAVEFMITSAAPSGSVLLAASLAGSGPLPTPLGIVLLSEPIQLLKIIPTDPAGNAILPLGTVPAGFLRLVLHNQALDLAIPALSNGFAATIL